MSYSESNLVMILSAHCILFNEVAASTMIKEFKDKNIGAVFEDSFQLIKVLLMM